MFDDVMRQGRRMQKHLKGSIENLKFQDGRPCSIIVDAPSVKTIRALVNNNTSKHRS